MQPKFAVDICIYDKSLKQGAVCPGCFIILGDAICVWNKHVYTECSGIAMPTQLLQHCCFAFLGDSMVYCLTPLVFSMLLAHSEYSSTESSGVFSMISLISSQNSKWALFLKDYWSSGKTHWRPPRGSWGYLHIFRDRDLCTAEAEQGTDCGLIHEMVRLSSDAEQRQPPISKGLGILTFEILKWRNCPATVRMEHAMRVYLGLVKYTHHSHLVTVSAERNPQKKWSGLVWMGYVQHLKN